MGEKRPDPEAILAKVKKEEALASRGRLKIFLGAAAGVGKTFSMLSSAQGLAAEGVDVVAGVVVTHGRPDTVALLEGLEVIAPQKINYKDRIYEEFDLDSALKRHPKVILVDELAHTNIEGARHNKRWQDVEELLKSGIDVYTTVNIQHLESANDIVNQITGVRVKETVPDSILEESYDVELVDLAPDELLQRIKEGKVYVSDKGKAALEGFFQKGNLIALRELALRATADRVEEQMREYRNDQDVETVWPASDKILVCVSASPLSARLLRAAKRMAGALHADWVAVSVDTPGTERLPESIRHRIYRHLHLAEQLGGEAVTLAGEKVAEEIVAYARKHNVTKIVVGKPNMPRWKEVVFGSVVDDIIRLSGDMDVYVITGQGDASDTDSVPKSANEFKPQPLLKAFFIVIAATVFASVFLSHLALVNIAMLYQLAIVVIALRYGKLPSIMASILSVLFFDFFFVPPFHSFAVSDYQYCITLVVMLVTALTLSTLTFRIKHQAETARRRERQTAAIYAMTRDLASAVNKQSVLKTGIQHMCEVFGCRAAVFTIGKNKDLILEKNLEPSYEVNTHEFGVAQWVLSMQQVAGAGTATLPGARAIYFPLTGANDPVGVLGILPKHIQMDVDERHLLETFVRQIALALERAKLSQELADATSVHEILEIGSEIAKLG
jgi:two-component system sensor histidine kinase KdpD